MVVDRRQIVSVLLGLISSLLACMQLNVALLNAEISYARRQLDTCKLFTLSTAQYGRQKQLDEQESNAVLDDSGLDLQEPVPLSLIHI